MQLNFTATEEYVVEGTVVVIDPSFVFENKVWREIEDKLNLMVFSGILAYQNVELFIFKWEEGTWDIRANSKKYELTCDSSFFAIITKDNLKKLNGEPNLGVSINIPERDTIEYKGDRVVGPIQIEIELSSEYDDGILEDNFDWDED